MSKKKSYFGSRSKRSKSSNGSGASVSVQTINDDNIEEILSIFTPNTEPLTDALRRELVGEGVCYGKGF